MWKCQQEEGGMKTLLIRITHVQAVGPMLFLDVVFWVFCKQISSSFEPVNEMHQAKGFLKCCQAQITTYSTYYNNVPLSVLFTFMGR